jgi:hypothetical protein
MRQAVVLDEARRIKGAEFSTGLFDRAQHPPTLSAFSGALPLDTALYKFHDIYIFLLI